MGFRPSTGSVLLTRVSICIFITGFISGEKLFCGFSTLIFLIGSVMWLLMLL